MVLRTTSLLDLTVSRELGRLYVDSSEVFSGLRVRVDLDRGVAERGRGVRERSLVERRRSDKFPLWFRDLVWTRDSVLVLRFLARNTCGKYHMVKSLVILTG